MSPEAAPAAAEAPAAGAGGKPPLDEVMLAMDVVDTLRRRERLVQRELDVEGREEDLKERLRKIYKAQGFEVPDHVIEQGVAALREERFVYKPPPEGIKKKLALLYVTRRKWGKWALGCLAAVLVAWGIHYFTVVAPTADLPGRIEAVHAQVLEIAASDEARAAAGQYLSVGRAALRDDNTAAAEDALASLEDLRARLEQEYTLRIVNRPGEQSGVWRIPDVNLKARNYYIIVEAIDVRGEVLTVPVLNEETGKTERVKKWGLRVEESTFNAIASDKKDDGIIQGSQFGKKKRGRLEPAYELPTTGSAITQW
jgi:hypothetical protein